MDIQKLNLELAAALGVPAPDRLPGVHRVVLTIDAGELPQVEIHRHCLQDGATLATSISELRAKREPGDPAPQFTVHVSADGQGLADVAGRALGLEPGERQLLDLERLRLEAGDIVVLRAPGRISEDTAKRLRDFWEGKFPEHKCVVLGDGISLSAVALAQLQGKPAPRAVTTALDLPAPNLPNHAAERRAWAELMLPAGLTDPGDDGLAPEELASWRAWAHRAALELMRRD